MNDNNHIENDAQSEEQTVELEIVPPPEEDEHELEAKQNESFTPEQIADLQKRAQEGQEYLDLLKRTKADFANFQKRVSEDRKRWAEQAKRELITDILLAADQCRVAAEKSDGDDSVESLRGALKMTWSEIERFLSAAGVKPIRAEGAEFDPCMHQALHVQERDDIPDATVIQEIIRGYEFAGQVIRPAQVVVAKAPKPPEEPLSEREADTDAEGENGAAGSECEQ